MNYRKIVALVFVISLVLLGKSVQVKALVIPENRLFTTSRGVAYLEGYTQMNTGYPSYQSYSPPSYLVVYDPYFNTVENIDLKPMEPGWVWNNDIKYVGDDKFTISFTKKVEVAPGYWYDDPDYEDDEWIQPVYEYFYEVWAYNLITKTWELYTPTPTVPLSEQYLEFTGYRSVPYFSWYTQIQRVNPDTGEESVIYDIPNHNEAEKQWLHKLDNGKYWYVAETEPYYEKSKISVLQQLNLYAAETANKITSMSPDYTTYASAAGVEPYVSTEGAGAIYVLQKWRQYDYSRSEDMEYNALINLISETTLLSSRHESLWAGGRGRISNVLPFLNNEVYYLTKNYVSLQMETYDVPIQFYKVDTAAQEGVVVDGGFLGYNPVWTVSGYYESYTSNLRPYATPIYSSIKDKSIYYYNLNYEVMKYDRVTGAITKIDVPWVSSIPAHVERRFMDRYDDNGDPVYGPFNVDAVPIPFRLVTALANGSKSYEGKNFYRTINSPPSITVTNATAWATIGNYSFNVTGTAFDSDGDSIQITCTIGGQTRSVTVGSGNNWTLTFNVPEGIPEGYYYNIPVWASDGKSTVSAQFAGTLLVDRNGPAQPPIYLSNSYWSSGDISFTLGSSWDAFSGVMKLQYKIGAGEWIDYPNYPITVSSEGVTPIYARAVDNAWNPSTEAGATAYIDKTRPGSPGITGTLPYWINGDAQFSLIHGVDGLSGTWKTVYSLDGGPWTDYVGTVNIPWSGVHTIYAQTFDYAGNGSEWAGAYAYVDKTAPIGGAVLNNPGWTNENVTISFTGDDPGGSGVQRIQLPNGAWVPGYTASYVATENGTYNFVVEDGVGNLGTVPVGVWNIDRVNPTATSVTNNGALTTNDTFDVFANGVTDNASGVAEVQFKVWTQKTGEDDVRWYSASNLGGGTWKYTVNRSHHKNEPGVYLIEAYAKDVVGNQAKVGQTQVILNKYPGVTLNGPSDTSFKIGQNPAFNTTFTDADGDTLTAYLERYNGTAWEIAGMQTGISSEQTVNIRMLEDDWDNLPYDVDQRFRVSVTDGYVTSYSGEKVIRKVNTEPTLDNLKPVNSQYMLSGFLNFSWDAVDPDNQGYDFLHLKIYTDTPNVANGGVFYDGDINKGIGSHNAYVYMAKGTHTLYFEISDGRTTTLITRTIKIPEEVSLSTGNDNKSFYLSHYDLEKNEVYYKRINNQLTDLISIINILGQNGNLNESYINNIDGMQNVTGDDDYTDNGDRIYTRDEIDGNRIADWISGEMGQSGPFSQVLESGTEIQIKNILFLDEEKDYVTTNPDRGKDRRFRFFHIPNLYDNPSEAIQENGVWLKDTEFTSFDGQPVDRSTPDISLKFDKPGKYILDILEDDEVQSSQGIDFSKSSNLLDYVMYVHRKPQAVINYEEIAPFTIKLDSTQSYDLDFYTSANKGIKLVEWEYRLIDYSDNLVQGWVSVTNVDHFVIDPAYKTEIKLRVTDQGALLDVENDGELTSETTLLLDDTGRPPKPDFEYRVGTSSADSKPSWGIAYKGKDGDETVWFDDSSTVWNDLLAVGGTRTKTWQYDETAFNSYVDNSSLTAPEVKLFNALTVTNKYNLTDWISKGLTIKRVEIANNTVDTMDAEMNQMFEIALTSIDGVLQWSDLDVRVSSVDLGYADISLDNTGSNIFEKELYVPETSRDDCMYSVNVYSKRTGELLLTREFPLIVVNIFAYDFTVTSILDIAWRGYYFDLDNGIDDNGDGTIDRYPKKENTEIKTPMMPINTVGGINYPITSVKTGYKVSGYIRVCGNPSSVTLIAKYTDNSGAAVSVPIQTTYKDTDRYTFEWIIPDPVQFGTYIYFDIAMTKGASLYGNERWRDTWHVANPERFVFYIMEKAMDDIKFNQSH